MTRARTILAVLAALAAPACDGEQELAVGSDESAVEAVACSAATVAWDTSAAGGERVCAGPWQYQAYASPCYAERTDDPACPAVFDDTGHYVYAPYADPCIDYAACAVATEVVSETVSFTFGVRWPHHTGLPTGLEYVVLTDETPAEALAVAEAHCDQLLDAWFADQASRMPDDLESRVERTPLTLETCEGCGPATVAYFEILVGFRKWETFQCRATYHNLARAWRDEPARINYRVDGVAVTDHPCPVDRVYECVDPNHPLRHPCRDASFGLDPDPTACGVADGLYFSAAGLPREALGTVANAVCLTGEDLPLAEPEDARARQAALLARIEHITLRGGYPGVDNAALLAQLVRRAKLTFELAGGSLSGPEGDVVHDPALGDQLDASLRLYSRYPGAAHTPACGRVYEPPVTTGCKAGAFTLSKLNAELAICDRLLSSHIAPATRARESVYLRCVDLPARMTKLRDRMLAGGERDDGGAAQLAAPDACSFKEYRERYHAVVTHPLRQLLASAVDPRTPEGAWAMRLRMTFVDRWSRAARKLYPDAATAQARWAQTSAVTAALWRGVYRELYPMDVYDPASPVIGDPADEDEGATPDLKLIAAAASDQLEADRAVIELAFAPWQSPNARVRGEPAKAPLTTEPLLYVTADALATVHLRLGDLALYHDVACAFLGCDGEAYPSETARMWRLLAALADRDQLDAEISVSRTVRDEHNQPVVREASLAFFVPIAANHAALDAAMADATDLGAVAGAARMLVTTHPANMPASAEALAAIVRDGRAKAAAYAGGGLLLGPANRLTAGAHEEYLISRRQALRLFTDNLHEAVLRRQATMVELATAILQQFDYTKLEAGLVNQAEQLALEIDELQRNQAAIRAAVDDADRAFADRMAGYGATATIDPDAAIAVSSLAPRTFSASSAVATLVRQDGEPVSAIATGAPIELAAGEILNLETRGQWSPSCALRGQGDKVIPDAELADRLRDEQPVTGPEGYVMTVSGSQYAVGSREEARARTTSTDLATSLAVCAGGRLGYKWDFGAIAEVYTSLESCFRASYGSSNRHSVVDETVTGADNRTSAQFAVGLRLPFTPFPDLPAGSLLLVMTEPGDDTAIRDIRIVQAPYTTVVADADMDVYYVVNDIAQCHPKDDSRRLEVDGTVLQHRGALTDRLEPAVAEALRTIDAKRPTLVQQGRLTPHGAAMLRSDALAKLSARAGLDLDDLPPSVLAFAEAGIDAAIARIELELEHDRVELALSGKLLQLRGLADDVRRTGAQGRIATLLPGWALRRLDADATRDQARLLAELLLRDLFPVVALRHRAAFAYLATQPAFSKALVALLRTPWDAPIDETGDNLVKASVALLNALEVVVDRAPEHEAIIVVSIPNPGADEEEVSLALAVDPARADAFWAGALSDDHRASITIEPGDLYARSAGQRLGCAWEAPVIRDVALVFGGLPDSDAQIESARGWHAVGGASASMMFPTATLPGPGAGELAAGGPLTMDLTDASWTAPMVPLLFVGGGVVARNAFLDARPAGPTMNAARGLSPFATYSFDLSALWDPAQRPVPPELDFAHPILSATQAFLVFRVEARGVGPDRSLEWIRACQP